MSPLFRDPVMELPMMDRSPTPPTQTPRSKSAFSASLCALALALPLLAPTAADAQVRGISWDETTSFEVPGTLGVLLRAIPGSPLSGMESSHALYLEGSALRQDDGSSSTVIDLERREILSIDHDSRSYMRFSFADAGQMAMDMDRMMQEAMLEMEQDEEMREAMRQQEEAMEEMRRQQEESTVEMNFRITSEATGQTESLGDGITGRQHFVLAELEVTDEIEGAEREGGILTILVELWQSDDLPDAEQLYEAWAEQLAQDPEIRALAEEMAASFESSGHAEGAEALSMWDPRISAGLMQLAEEIEEIGGTTVRSTTTVALVPTTVEFSRDDLVAWEPESMGGALASSAGDAVRDAARGALRGMFGGRGGGDDEPAEEAPTIQPLLRMTTVKANVHYAESGTSVIAPLYEAIQEYQEINLAELMEQIQREMGEGG
ncbi:MAG: hypothetical protein EA351_08650 [Gemmatimonadales bacterium]|nr:MAG: hypothetical protein EA351_08650 [Gemmatimonadales bacterium]